MRDDFDPKTKEILAKRVGYRCSNPKCRKLTGGPRTDPAKVVNIGVAAHITAASEGGPRYASSLSPEGRRSVDNGIWLCQNCAKLVDNDVQRYTAALLREWKQRAEEAALREIEGASYPFGPRAAPPPASASGAHWATQGLYEQVAGGVIAGVIVAVATALMTQNLWLGILVAVLSGAVAAIIVGRLIRSREPVAGPAPGQPALRTEVEQMTDLDHPESDGIEVHDTLPQEVQPRHSGLSAPRTGSVSAISIDPENPPIAAIRRLLLAAFTAEELRRFCQERSDFRPIVTRFGPGHGLDDMVDHVIDYCQTRLMWGELLVELARVNPRQFVRFEERLRKDAGGGGRPQRIQR